MSNRPRLRSTLIAGLVVAGLLGLATEAGAHPGLATSEPPQTTTPIKHVVVIFGENISFDHYFGTYAAKRGLGVGRPQNVNGLWNSPGAGGVGTLLTNNPNQDTSVSPPVPANPRRLDPANLNDILLCDQDHGYTDEQKAFDGGKMDNFPSVSKAYESATNPNGVACKPTDVMNYYDGDTVTALWNYAGHFAMNDRSFGTTFGPSAPGAINLVSGNTGGVDTGHAVTVGTDDWHSDVVSDGVGGSSLIDDAQPYWDDCSTRDAVGMTGQNIGDELNAKNLSWGWFEGGFRPTTSYAQALGALKLSQPTSTFTPDQFSGKFTTAPLPKGVSDQGLCNAFHPIGPSVGGIGGNPGGGPGQYGSKPDYIPHHEPFQFYPGTANPHHLAPVSLAAIGTDTQTGYAAYNSKGTNSGPLNTLQFDTANHNYDVSDFDALVGAITHGQLPPDSLPAVSFLKAPGYQDGHAQYSNPLDEQQFVVREVNALEHSPAWSSTAVILNWDDSDGFYDHVFAGTSPGANAVTQNPSKSTADVLNTNGLCGTGTGSGTPVFSSQNGRCGYGPRLPFLVVSRYAQRNLVDHTMIDQSSIINFVEHNWNLSPINGSADSHAGSLLSMFDFAGPQQGNNPALILDPTTGREP